jgi:hypothetical protein
MTTSIYTVEDWQRVPARVAELLPCAHAVKVAHEQAGAATHVLSHTVAAWNPTTNAVTLYSPIEIAADAREKYAAVMAERGYSCAAHLLSSATPDFAQQVVVKRGSLVPGLPAVWNTGNTLMAGPSPLSNGIMTGLLAGGTGYGAGMLAEQLFPERYIERGKLRRTLGLLGALSGAAVAGLGGYANARALRTSFPRGLITNNNTAVVYPYEKKMQEREKSSMFPGQPPALYSPIVSVPQFNQAAWQDVNRGMRAGNFSNYTPPAYAAATTGLMSGISTSMQSPIIRPIDVIHGIASAGVGLATATLAGKALSAMAGLTPAGQAKLQDLGLWGGMMHAVVPSLFGR